MEVSQPSASSQLILKIKKIGTIVIVAGLIIFLLVFFYGSEHVHTDQNHNLYDSFDLSPDHAQLLSKLSKNKLSILYGRKEAGLFQFAEHYANNLSLAGHNVFIEDITKKNFKMYKIARAARKSLDQWFGIEKQEGDWFIYSRDGRIVSQDIIDKIRKGNPKSKITIVTPSLRQRNKGFKEMAFPEVDEHQIEQSIERNFQVSENTADILYDYFGNAQNAFLQMNFQYFTHQGFLGDSYRSLEGLSKEDNRILKDLCKKGEGHSEAQSLALTEMGVVFYNRENYWLNPEARLNYQLHKDINCKNKLISDSMLRQVEELREREAEEERDLMDYEEEDEEQEEGRKKRGKKRRRN